jgi:hypothetical protein
MSQLDGMNCMVEAPEFPLGSSGAALDRKLALDVLSEVISTCLHLEGNYCLFGGIKTAPILLGQTDKSKTYLAELITPWGVRGLLSVKQMS